MISETAGHLPRKLPLKLAIVGGGRACKFFLESAKNDFFTLLDIEVVGVCDLDPNAKGLLLAREMGIFTTDNFRDLFKIKNLEGILELTNDEDVFLELVKLRPKGVGVLEHDIGRLIRNLFILSQRLKSVEKQVILEKMSSDFLIQQSDAAIVVLNTDYIIAEANEAYLKIVNKSKAEVVGTPCYQAYYGLNAPCSVARPELPCPMLETLRTGKSAHVIHEFPTTTDRQTYGNIVTYPLKDQTGQILRIIEIWRDITDKINSGWNKRVAELKDDLKKMVQEDRMISLGKLVASCVHEINNPLQGLLTFSHIMQEVMAKNRLSRKDILDCRHFIGLMATELERCGKIVSGLLSFSRESPLEYKEINLNDIIRSVVSLTRHKIELQNIRLNIEMSEFPLRITGDTNRLQQCLLNLIFNAVEAMPQGGDLHVKTRSGPNHKCCKVTIKDTGCGIPKADLDHIYDPFFTTKPEGEGTGLGLSIVYGVVKNHRGKIKVKSREGEGTTFILNFPLA